jgi:GH25 family lysozyme M1 (1,4-beta-N-acetylmuramidase)
MKNNQINGSEHFEDLKDMIRNHPSLHIIDLSNSESNVNKNKLRNAGVAAIIDGILESTKQGHSLINELNLSYN